MLRAQLLEENAALRARIAALEAAAPPDYQLFETLSQGVVYQDAAGGIMAANPAAQRMLGLTLAQMQGRTSLDPRWRAIHADGSAFLGETHPAMVALRTGQAVRDEVMGIFHPQDETYHWLQVAAIPQFRPGETRPCQVYTSFSDITQRKQAETEREQVYRLLETTLSNLTEAVFVIDARDRTIRLCNTTAEGMFGYRQAELARLDRHALFASEAGGAAFDQAAAAAYGNHSHFQAEAWMRRRNQEVFAAEILARPVLGAADRIENLVIVVRDIAELKRQEQTRQRQLADLQALHRLAVAGAGGAAEAALIAQAADLIRQALQPAFFGVALREATTGVCHWHPAGTPLGNGEREPGRFDQHVFEQVIRDGRPCVVADLADAPAGEGREPPAGAAFYAPLQVGGRVLGVLAVKPARSQALTAADENLLMTLANQLAIALERTQLFEAEQQHRRELEAILSVSIALRKAQTRERLLPLLVEEIQAVLPAAGCSLLLAKDEQWTVAAGCGIIPWPIGSEVPAEAVDVALAAPLVRPPLIPGSVVAQLQSADGLLGALWLTFPEPAALMDTELRILTAIAEMAGNTLQRVALFETLEHRVADRTRELGTLYDVSALASDSLDLTTILTQALVYTLSTVGFSRGIIHIQQAGSGGLSRAAHWGLPETPAVIPADRGLIGWVYANDQTLAVPDAAVDPRGRAEPELAGGVFYIGAPMHVHGEVVGVLSLYGQAGEAISAEEVALVSAVADQLGLAVDRARLRHQAEQAAVLDERQRLGRDLHDSVTQSVYGVSLMAETIRRRLASAQYAEARECVAELGAEAQQALKEMRLLLFELRPSALEQVGLVAALQHRLEAVERRVGLETSLVLGAGLELTPDLISQNVSEQLYWLAQEALNNILKHSRATEARITLWVDRFNLWLEITDNGCGFEPAADLTRRGGLGLVGMRERAAALKGSLTLRSAPGQGTTVRVQVPVVYSEANRFLEEVPHE